MAGAHDRFEASWAPRPTRRQYKSPAHEKVPLLPAIFIFFLGPNSSSFCFDIIGARSLCNSSSVMHGMDQRESQQLRRVPGFERPLRVALSRTCPSCTPTYPSPISPPTSSSSLKL
ncbi:hypothetical protein NL676_023089 [Syzygium grande]|nr:hypothetical protein NL676_023089 [Syzygium grande]